MRREPSPHCKSPSSFEANRRRTTAEDVDDSDGLVCARVVAPVTFREDDEEDDDCDDDDDDDDDNEEVETSDNTARPRLL